MMFGGNNVNQGFPVYLEENQFQYDSSASTQLQLFGNFPAGFNLDTANYVGNSHISALNRPSKRTKEAEEIAMQQKLQISLNDFCQDEADRSASIANPNGVSTGLRLYSVDDERNSSVTSASGSMPALSIITSLRDNLRTEIERQKEELGHYIRVQEENFTKGVREMKQRHTASFLSTIEKEITRKLSEKELEIESMNRKNKELLERLKQVAMEAQSWYHRACYNESMVNALKSSLKKAIAQGAADQGREGCGDSEVDDAASSFSPKNLVLAGLPQNPMPGYQGSNQQMICKACKCKESCMLLLPCRHLCMCMDCDGFIDVCPVCQSTKTASVQVYLS